MKAERRQYRKRKKKAEGKQRNKKKKAERRQQSKRKRKAETIQEQEKRKQKEDIIGIGRRKHKQNTEIERRKGTTEGWNVMEEDQIGMKHEKQRQRGHKEDKLLWEKELLRECVMHGKGRIKETNCDGRGTNLASKRKRCS